MTQHLFADGGVIQRNPSPIGGTYAWCLTDDAVEGEFVTGRSGAVLCAGSGLTHLAGAAYPVVDGPVSNNLTEFIALTLGLEHLPAGWTGQVCSDSQVTLGRLFWSWKLTGLPMDWIKRGMAARQRLGTVEVVLLQGHPTKADLARGTGAKRGYPVSRWNVWCDQKCGEEAATLLAARADSARSGDVSFLGWCLGLSPEEDVQMVAFARRILYGPQCGGSDGQ